MLFASLRCMNCRKVFSYLAVILTAAVLTKAQEPSVDPNRVRAQQLWEEAIQAKGGRERLHSIKNFFVSSTINVESQRGESYHEVERLYAFPGRAWIFEYTAEFDVSVEATVINVEQKLCMRTLAPAVGGVPPLSRCLPTTFVENVVQNSTIYLMETRWFRPVPLRTREARTGLKRVDVVETVVADLRVDFYLDRKTKLPIKIVTDRFLGPKEATTSMGLTVYLDGYKTVDGIKMPRSVVREPNFFIERIRRDLEFASYKFNVDHDETIFDHPASQKVKAGDWKPR